IMTRTGNQTRSRNDRITVARQYKPDAFVAVHSDYASNASISGTHAFYYYPWSMELAKCVHEQMVAAYRSSIYPPGTVEYEQADRGVKFYPFQVTRLEECPAILIECGFVSNASDCSVLLTPSCQDIIAAAVANGIVSYLNSLD
ncbi:MAG: N-acetylmuramoyl-L-alanine amidase, partial [Clostridia bacterium]|nr:N-acetylmuramoyl-L-alanine amidase [Clostridia bacterium]